MNDAVSRWRVVLDHLDADTDATRAALDEGRPVSLTEFVPPSDLPPLPIELADHARDVAARQHAVRSAVERQMHAVGAAMAGSNRRAPHTSTARSAARFETRV